MTELLLAIGLVLIIEGLAYALFPRQLKEAIRLALSQPDQTLRTIGLIAASVGVVIVWMFKP